MNKNVFFSVSAVECTLAFGMNQAHRSQLLAV